MVLRDFDVQNEWLFTIWQLTYKVGWKGVLYIAEAMFPYLERGEVLSNAGREDEAKLTEKVFDKDKRFMSLLDQEEASLTVRGISKILKCPFQMTVYNQTNVCEVSLPVQFFKDYDTCENKYQQISEMLGQLLNSAEILGHVWMSKS